ncbi:uncharacterized protein LOC133917898, partial [Phragmites australis]|uniref:uncharacterized protein LOC133917898 n=1 Tax=Phragmites australis TaxID=29695 RepID=UPI002D7946C4
HALVRQRCGGDGEPKVACDGTALSDSDTEDECDDPYAPAESLWLRIGEDIDWSDVGAVAVLERDDSTKGAGANPKSAARRSATTGRTSMSAATPRKIAVVIGGLPPAAGKVAWEHGRRRTPCRLGGRARVFAAREAVDRQAEPASPEVSCLGAVRSEPQPAADGISGRRWWAWFMVDVICCCSNRRAWRAQGSEAD